MNESECQKTEWISIILTLLFYENFDKTLPFKKSLMSLYLN